MRKFWRIVYHEYTRHVLRRRFLLGLLSVPLVMAVMALVVFLLVRSETDNRPIGYVDQAGFLTNPLPASPSKTLSKPVAMMPFETEALARTALENKEIQAYYVLSADFLQTGQAKLITLDKFNSSAGRQFEAFVRANLLAGQPEYVIQRLNQGDNLVVRSADGTRQMAQDDWFNIFTPFIAGLALMIAMFTASGYLMQAVVEEKENRTMEVLVTSVSPGQLMGGKVVGIIGVGLTQLLAWGAMAVLVILVGRNYIDVMRRIHFSIASVGLLMAILIPSFVMISGLMATVGAIVPDGREGQQLTSLFTLPVVLPYWFTYQIMTNPNGPLAVALSVFPLTAPVTLTMRMGFANIPAWQVALNISILVVSAVVALWLAGRTFRLGMLRYGQRLSWREIFGRVE
jgi:ABC-2 type transport system permease protein